MTGTTISAISTHPTSPPAQTFSLPWTRSTLPPSTTGLTVTFPSPNLPPPPTLPRKTNALFPHTTIDVPTASPSRRRRRPAISPKIRRTDGGPRSAVRPPLMWSARTRKRAWGSSKSITEVGMTRWLSRSRRCRHRSGPNPRRRQWVWQSWTLPLPRCRIFSWNLRIDRIRPVRRI